MEHAFMRSWRNNGDQIGNAVGSEVPLSSHRNKETDISFRSQLRSHRCDSAINSTTYLFNYLPGSTANLGTYR